LLTRFHKMIMPGLGYGVLGNFNPDVEKVCKQIKEEIDKEKKQPNPDKSRISKLAQELMVRGLALNTGYMRHF